MNAQQALGSHMACCSLSSDARRFLGCDWGAKLAARPSLGASLLRFVSATFAFLNPPVGGFAVVMLDGLAALRAGPCPPPPA